MTNNQQIKNVTLENIEAVLEVHGSNFDQMPASIAKDIKALIINSDKAAQIYKQAKFIDEALNQSELAQSDEKIMAMFDMASLEASIQQNIAKTKQIENNGSDAETITSNNVVKFTNRKDKQTTNNAMAAHNQSVLKNWKTSLAAPGLIAASLLMGLMFGVNGGTSMLLGDTALITMASNEITDDILYLDTDYNLGELAEPVQSKQQ